MSFTRRTRDLGWALTVAMLAGCSASGTEELGQVFQAAALTNLKATLQQTTSWGTGYCANVNIANNGSATASTWTVVLELNQATIYTSWNANFSGNGSRKTITPVSWNATIAPGTMQTIGYCANNTGTNHTPQIISPLGNPGTGGAPGVGGSVATGGVATGGVATGGVATGGVATGGVATGGVATGGVATGGVATGGVATGGMAGYAPVGEYLINPDLAIATLKSLADFRAKSRDNVNGGFFTFVNMDGTVGTDHRKGFVTTSRDAWTFSRAFMVTGDETYLDHAAHALKHLFEHGWDNVRGGWYFTGDETGNLTPYSPYWDPNTWKWSFVQHYALLGIGASCDATRDATTCAWLQKGRNVLDSKMWDFTPGRLGYYEQADLNLGNPHNKGFTATVDALTTNAIQTELIWPNTAYHQRMVDLADIATDRLAANMDLGNVKFGFPEIYNSAWSVDTSQTTGDVGHVLKSAWVLARVYLRHPDARYRDAARKFIYEVLNNGGWDSQNGVPYTTYNWNTGAVTKLAECWQIEQAITSGLSNWYIADNQADKDAFLAMADRALQFFSNYVIDHTYGGTYKMNTVTGAPTGDPKSNFYNVEYHSTETFYFTYLYGNLMLHRTPVALYYQVAALPNQQVIQLNPVAIDDASLQIRSVTLNGLPLGTFQGPTREVTLAAGQGGKLRVVFGPSS
ncbi:MAG TPA: AGE family epimerase/isomerase [Polyangiaceae bacterium]